MTWFHSTPGRSSRRDQHRRRTPTPQDDTYNDDDDDDDSTSVVQSDHSPNDTELDQPANDNDNDNDNDDDDEDDLFSSVSERNNVVRKETVASNSSCSASNTSPHLSQPAGSYMNIAPFPTFRGGSDECPFAHLSRFAKVCRANNVSSVDMMARIFPVTLEDEAALWYDLNVEPYELAWEEIKSSFSHAYGKIEVADQLRSQLMTINQGNEEPVRSYFLRLQWILRKWPEHGLSDDLLKGLFVDGLRSDFQKWIAPQKPCSLNEALRLAFCFEQVKSVRGVRRNAAVKCGFCEGLHEERACEVRGRMRELWLRSKDEGKGMLVGLERNLSGKSEGVKELGKTVSIGKNSGVEAGKEEGELGLGLGLKKRSQCQCGKHQCWKKNLERNNSTISGSFKGE